MKKVLTYLFFLFSFLIIQSQVKTKFSIGSFEYIIENPYSNISFEVSINKYNNCPTGSLTIPETIYWSYNNKTYKIIGISDNAFIDCNNLTEVIFPKSIKYIGETAFKNTGLVNLIYPKNLDNIGSGAFRNCKNLKNIYIEEGVTYLGNNTFSWCSNLINVTLPNSILSIGYGTFSACKNLEKIVLPNSIKTIGSGIFGGCLNLENVTISNSLKNITYNTFSGCKNLTSIIIPNSIENIESGTFSDCGSLTSIIIPNNVVSIGDYAFYNCKNLTKVVINTETPIKINETVFKDVDISNIPLFVANGKENLYKNEPIWKDFKSITILKENEINQEMEVKLFPNPTKNKFKIILNKNEGLEKIIIYNNLGQKVLSKKASEINIENLKSGIYTIDVYIDKGKFSKKLIIE